MASAAFWRAGTRQTCGHKVTDRDGEGKRLAKADRRTIFPREQASADWWGMGSYYWLLLGLMAICTPGLALIAFMMGRATRSDERLSSNYLRRQAETCLRLAGTTTDARVATELVTMAEDLYAKATEVESHQYASA